MKQSKKQAHIETSINMALGFLISIATWELVAAYLIAPGIIEVDDGFTITCIFTAVSYVRAYTLRRLFASIHT